MKKGSAILFASLLALCTACSNENIASTSVSETEVSVPEEGNNEMSKIEELPKLELTKCYKLRGNTNPVMTQAFGADPYACVYKDTVYFYMTADAFEYDKDGNVVENTYGKIRSIHVISTKDMKNFTDHGEIPIGGKDGIAKWAANSWAPAVCWKNIDGVDKFFLYFADNGGGIGVLTADSPTGPFTDPLGHGLITRSVPNCANVLWLFDPAVLVDDDGTGYLYFGGGVPDGRIADPGTGRVVRLNDDMISLACDPVAIDIPYHFEDSGIHKVGNKYYYSYCTNWSIDQAGTDKYGFKNAEIAILESDNPMGPFTYKETALSNPGQLCGLYGNNHHCFFWLNDQLYITFHSRMLEKNMGIEHGYRITCIEKVNVKEDGTLGRIKQTYEGPDQIGTVDPYLENSAVCVSAMAGTNSVSESKDISYGNIVLTDINTGDYIEVTGVSFGEQSPESITIKANVPSGTTARIRVRAKFANSADLGVIELSSTDGEYKEFTAPVNGLTGTQYLYFIFEGEGYTVKSWKFN